MVWGSVRVSSLQTHWWPGSPPCLLRCSQARHTTSRKLVLVVQNISKYDINTRWYLVRGRFKVSALFAVHSHILLLLLHGLLPWFWMGFDRTKPQTTGLWPLFLCPCSDSSWRTVPRVWRSSSAASCARSVPRSGIFGWFVFFFLFFFSQVFFPSLRRGVFFHLFPNSFFLHFFKCFLQVFVFWWL